MTFQDEILSKRTNPDKDDFNHEKIRQWSTWKSLQRKTYIRDDFTCVICKKITDKKNLTVNHKIPVRLDKSKWFDLNNLETTCKNCHKELNVLDYMFNPEITSNKSDIQNRHGVEQ